MALTQRRLILLPALLPVYEQVNEPLLFIQNLNVLSTQTQQHFGVGIRLIVYI